jgi:hypothetical protein
MHEEGLAGLLLVLLLLLRACMKAACSTSRSCFEFNISAILWMAGLLSALLFAYGIVCG